MNGLQQNVDFLWLELQLVKGAREVLQKCDDIAGLSALHAEHELIGKVVLRVVPLLVRLQGEIDGKIGQMDDARQRVLVLQKRALQLCVDVFGQEPIDLTAARAALAEIVKLAPEKAKNRRGK